MILCQHCNTESVKGAKFCHMCGKSLTAQANNETNITAEAIEKATAHLPEAIRRLMPNHYVEKLISTKGQIEGERRIVTILFSDVKGSTSLAENLDPEEVMEIMNGAFEVLIKPITRYEGTLARLMGDAILAFFGAQSYSLK